MKNKKIIIGTILLLFAISGICNIVSVSADSWNDVKIPSLSYVYVGTKTLEYKDELKLSVSSSGVINVYIMDASQFSTLQDSAGVLWEYCIRWRDLTSLEYTYLIQEDGKYYIVLYNKDILFSRTVDFSITIEYFYEPTKNFLWELLLFVVIPIVAITLVIVIPIILIRKHKRKTPKEETLKKYCQECGVESVDLTNEYCSKCGSRIIT